ARGQAGARAFERNAPARRSRARVRAEPEAAVARRAVRDARFADPLGAAGAPDGGPRAHASHGDLRHARRRRGDPPRGPCRDDDERAAREGRRRARDRLAVAPQPQGAARASELLPLPARAARLSRGLRRGRRGARSGGGMIARTRRRLVLVGNGMAGMRAIEELLALAPDLYEITVIGAEPHGNYNRILLSPVLAAEKTL